MRAGAFPPGSAVPAPGLLTRDSGPPSELWPRSAGGTGISRPPVEAGPLVQHLESTARKMPLPSERQGTLVPQGLPAAPPVLVPGRNRYRSEPRLLPCALASLGIRVMVWCWGRRDTSRESPLTLRPGASHSPQQSVSSLKQNPGTSVVVHGLAIRRPVQGTRVPSLVWEDPTCCGAAGPNATTTEPALLEPTLCNEKPLQQGAPATRSPHSAPRD